MLEMRINCVLGPFLPVPPLMGGAVERIWQNLCAEFAARGHEVTLISRKYGGLPTNEVVGGVTYARVQSANAPKSKLLYRMLDVLYAARVCLMLPAADITITNSVSLPLLLPRKRAGRIYVSVARFPKGQMGFYRRADRLQCVSSHVARSVVMQSPSVAALVKTIPNAISSVFASALANDRIPRQKEILFVGRIAREKGIEILLRAFARVHKAYPEWKLTIVGPNEIALGGDGKAYLSELEALSVKIGAPVCFVGPIFDEKDLVDRLKNSEIFVYPSIAAKGEALPLAPVEAMACGCAVVVSSLDCFNDYLSDGVNGLVFNVTDLTGLDLADKLFLLVRDAKLRESLGLEAVRTARSFTCPNVASSFLEDFSTMSRAAQ
jgi:glycosyltransferase involved in cell wall biosynthesis